MLMIGLMIEVSNACEIMTAMQLLLAMRSVTDLGSKFIRRTVLPKNNNYTDTLYFLFYFAY